MITTDTADCRLLIDSPTSRKLSMVWNGLEGTGMVAGNRYCILGLKRECCRVGILNHDSIFMTFFLSVWLPQSSHRKVVDDEFID